MKLFKSSSGFYCYAVCLLSILLSVSFVFSASPENPHYTGEIIIGFGAQGGGGGLKGKGTEVTGYGASIAGQSGRYLYGIGSPITRYDSLTKMLEVFCGVGATGYFDGGPEIAMCAINNYQNGGFDFSPDGSKLYFMDQQNSGGAVRILDITTGYLSTLAKGELGKATGGPQTIRGMAVGRITGNIYVTGYSTTYYKVTPDGVVTALNNLQTNVNGTDVSCGFIAVDEKRNKLYGMNRNYGDGAVFSWPLEGGDITFLNYNTLTLSRNAQYTSDGPLSGMAAANPMCLNMDNNGYVYMGAGDGLTFRRIDMDSLTVLSLCQPSKDSLYRWDIGDGSNNRLFNTWPADITFDKFGNGFFSYSVCPKVIKLNVKD